MERIGAKVDAATLLEKFITNMQRERSEVSQNVTIHNLPPTKVAFNIFTNGKQTLGLNLSERFSITDNALISMQVSSPASTSTFTLYLQWPDIDVTRMDQSETAQMFKSKLRFQIRSSL